jgi:gluconolactonase
MRRLAPLLCLFPIALAAQDHLPVQLEKIASGFRYATAPVWSREGFLLFADTPANVIIRWIPGQKPERFLEDISGPAGLGFDTSGRLYICEGRGRRVVRVDKNKKVETLAERWQGKRLNAPNDIAVRRDGHAWFTDPAFGYQQDARDLDFYGIFRMTSKGEIEPVAKWTTRPNGLALSPNGRTLYVADSDRRQVRSFEIDRGGNTSGERVFASNLDGIPNAITVDEKGNVYVAGRNISVFSPEGKRIDRIQFADSITGCAFGEADLQSLFVTAGGALYRVRLNVKGALQH